MEEQRESTAERIPNGVQHEIIDGNDQQGQHLVDRRLDLQEYPYGPCPYPVLNTRPAGQKEPYNETTSCVFPVNGAIPPGHKSTPSQYDTASSVTPGAPSDELPLSGFTFPGSWPPVPTASGLEAELRKAKTPPAGNWATGSRPTSDIDVSISSFLAEMPTNSQDPTRHVLWTELVRLKTRTLELQIAEAKQKEKEAELELARLKAVAERKAGPNGGDSNVALDQFTAGPPAGSSTTGTAESFHPLDTYPLIAHARPPMDVGPTGMQNCLNIPQEANGAPYDTVPTPMTPFDVEAMMQYSNMDSLFSWLPDFGETTRNDAYHQTAIDPSNLLASVPNKAVSHSSTLDEFREPLPAEPVPFTSPSVKHQRSLSPASSSSSAARTKKTKRNGEKKIVVEHSSACLTCSKPLARILIRAPKSQIPKKISVDFRCRACRAVAAPAVVPDPQTMGTPIGTVETRKRLRSQMEVDDEVPDEESRKAFCDVCQRIVGSGRVVGGEHKENMGRMAEIVCSSCDSKYQRYVAFLP